MDVYKLVTLHHIQFCPVSHLHDVFVLVSAFILSSFPFFLVLWHHHESSSRCNRNTIIKITIMTLLFSHSGIIKIRSKNSEENIRYDQRQKDITRERKVFVVARNHHRITHLLLSSFPFDNISFVRRILQ